VRTLTVGGRKMIVASRTGDGPLVCVTLTHPELAETLYVVNDIQSCVRDGNTFVAYPFRITFPDAREDAMPTATIEIDNVDRAIGEAVLALSSKPDVTVEVVRVSDVLSVEQGPWTMQLIACTITRLVVSGQLGMPSILSEPYPGGTYDPATFPQLFNA
jgi:hypothetical protein